MLAQFHIPTMTWLFPKTKVNFRFIDRNLFVWEWPTAITWSSGSSLQFVHVPFYQTKYLKWDFIRCLSLWTIGHHFWTKWKSWLFDFVSRKVMVGDFNIFRQVITVPNNAWRKYFCIWALNPDDCKKLIDSREIFSRYGYTVREPEAPLPWYHQIKELSTTFHMPCAR